MSDQVVNSEEHQDGTTASVPDQPRISAGSQLAALRQERGWTVEQVASHLNLAPRQIDALEADHYEALPGLVIVRGFIRAYAKLLRVDAAPILASVEPQAATSNVLPERAPLSASFSETSVPFGKRRGPSMPIVIGGIAVLCGVLFFAAHRAGWVPSLAASTSVAQDGSVTKELPVDVTTPVEPTPPQQTFSDDAPPQAVVAVESDVAKPVTSSVSSAPTSTVVNPAAVVASPTQASKPESPVVNTAPAAANAGNAATPAVTATAGQQLLGIQAKEDSWVEVKQPDNSVVVSRIFKAGSSESFAIPGPVSIVVGNASAVSLTLRGQPLEIKPSSNNVARLNVN